jgi:polyhydroxyalkanoate synthesis regulator phasin
MKDTDPFELWKKAVLIGLGATAVTMERIQELANELVERGEMSQKDAKSFADDLKTRAMKEKDQFESKMKDTVDTYMQSAVKSMGLVTREEFEALKKEMKAAKTNGSASSSSSAKKTTAKKK